MEVDTSKLSDSILSFFHEFMICCSESLISSRALELTRGPRYHRRSGQVYDDKVMCAQQSLVGKQCALKFLQNVSRGAKPCSLQFPLQKQPHSPSSPIIQAEISTEMHKRQRLLPHIPSPQILLGVQHLNGKLENNPSIQQARIASCSRKDINQQTSSYPFNPRSASPAGSIGLNETRLFAVLSVQIGSLSGVPALLNAGCRILSRSPSKEKWCACES